MSPPDPADRVGPSVATAGDGDLAGEDGRVGDAALRGVLVEEVQRRWPGAWIRHELDIAGGCRVDVATVAGDELVGWEIKSDRDSLARLPRQVAAYGGVFDRCQLVTTARHVAGAERHLPAHWGVWVLEPGGLVEQRPAGPNPGVDVDKVVQLLWRQDVLAVLRRRGLDRRHRRTLRRDLWALLVQLLDADELRALVRAVLAENHPTAGVGAGVIRAETLWATSTLTLTAAAEPEMPVEGTLWAAAEAGDAQ